MTDYALPGLAKVLERASRQGKAYQRYAEEETDGPPVRRRGRRAPKRRRRQRATYGRSVIDTRERKEYRRDSDEETAQKGYELVKGAGRVVGALKSEAGQKALGALKAVPLLSGAAIGLAISAGLAAYGITSYVIRKLKEKKEGREQLAFQASQAYRAARVELEERQGQPLSKGQQTQLANGFKAELKKLGLTTTNLF